MIVGAEKRRRIARASRKVEEREERVDAQIQEQIARGRPLLDWVLRGVARVALAEIARAPASVETERTTGAAARAELRGARGAQLGELVLEEDADGTFAASSFSKGRT